MDVRYTVGRNEYRRMTTEELRAAFLNTALCEAGKVKLMYCEVERGIAGFAVPTAGRSSRATSSARGANSASSTWGARAR